MKKERLVTDHGWRTVQFFLSPQGVYEAEVNLESSALRCNCPGFGSRAFCRHTRWITGQMEKHSGSFPLQVSSRANAHEAKEANASPEAMRTFVLKYGKVEVL